MGSFLWAGLWMVASAHANVPDLSPGRAPALADVQALAESAPPEGTAEPKRAEAVIQGLLPLLESTDPALRAATMDALRAWTGMDVDNAERWQTLFAGC